MVASLRQRHQEGGNQAADDLLEVTLARPAHGGGIGIPGKESRRHHIHPRIGALRRKDRRHQKLKWRFVFESTLCVWIISLEATKDSRGLGLFFRIRPCRRLGACGLRARFSS